MTRRIQKHPHQAPTRVLARERCRFSRREARPTPPSKACRWTYGMCLSPECRFDSLSSAASSAGAKPNHGFFYCQHSRAIFFARLSAGHRRRSRAMAKEAPPVSSPRIARAGSAAKKSLVFSCACTARGSDNAHRRTPGRHAPARTRATIATVCHLKFFCAGDAIPASHKRKCANPSRLCGTSRRDACGPARMRADRCGMPRDRDRPRASPGHHAARECGRP